MACENHPCENRGTTCRRSYGILDCISPERPVNQKQLCKHISIEEQKPKRIAFTKRYPLFLPLILWSKRKLKHIQDYSYHPFSKKSPQLPTTVYRHQSLLRRKLGGSDPRLQEQKITNLRRAIRDIHLTTIAPGETFSLWHHLGFPTKQKGYVGGMLLAGGEVKEGIGGGLCQLSNLLYWMFLHSPLTVMEQHHHSLDVFPDSGRTLPFGSGATIFYNLLDLKAKNNTSHPIQITLYLTGTHLKGRLLSDMPLPFKYHIREEDHCFIKTNHRWYRHNELWREIKRNGEILQKEHITTNIAPVLYDVDMETLKRQGYVYYLH